MGGGAAGRGRECLLTLVTLPRHPPLLALTTTNRPHTESPMLTRGLASFQHIVNVSGADMQMVPRRDRTNEPEVVWPCFLQSLSKAFFLET